MGTGVIFAIVVVAGLAYLVPWFVSRKHDVVELEDTDKFVQSMTIIRRSNGALVDPDAEDCEVSTPMTRRAALSTVDKVYRRATFRRRRIFVGLVLAALATLVVSLTVAVVPWWAPVVVAGLLVVHMVWSAASMKFIVKLLDRRVQQIKLGWPEETVSFVVPAELREDQAPADSTEHSVELSVALEPTGSLWEPIPVTAPNYVSTPLAPRTVRTIDLSAPQAPRPAVPVTNETQVLDEVPEGQDALPGVHIEQRPRAVGE